MSSHEQRRPRAFVVEKASDSRSEEFVIDEEDDRLVETESRQASNVAAHASAASRKNFPSGFISWSGLLWSGVSVLVSIAMGLWVSELIETAFSKFFALGWIAVIASCAALAALMGIGAREALGVLRQKRIVDLHARLADAHANDDRDSARAGVRDLAALYVKRPEAAAARSRIMELTKEIVDGRDLIEIAERGLLGPLDIKARGEIARAAKRVSVVTTLSPRALLDVLFVAAQAVRLVRAISEIYGGRPGLLGLFRVGRSVVSHLAVTGGMAAGDSIVQQIVGHGVAARMSARLGEGVLNGLMTARVGLSAIAVCRPSPFFDSKAPGVADVAPFLIGKDKA